MAKFTASLCVGHGDWDSRRVKAEGGTPEEAIAKCLEAVRGTIAVSQHLSDQAIIPMDIGSQVPEPPAGYRLLIMGVIPHGGGHTYGWRFFAVECGTTFALLKGGRRSGFAPRTTSKLYEAGSSPIAFYFTDCNTKYEFHFPSGTQEFVGGKWIPREVAEYDY